jgi:hypothetical protein
MTFKKKHLFCYKITSNMKQILFIIISYFIANSALGQTLFDYKYFIPDHRSHNLNIIYDDFDNDGDFDIVKRDLKRSLDALLQKNENGDFNLICSKYITVSTTPIISMDLNNDNYPDLITYRTFDTIGVLYNLKNDSFSNEEKIMNFSGSYSINPLKFDYNSDGFVDLFVQDNNDKYYVLINNKKGGFEPAKYIATIEGFGSIYKIEDFDNDKDFDLYVKNGNSISIYLNTNDVFEKLNFIDIYTSFDSYGILDIDGNGYKDILYWHDGALWAKYIDYNKVTNKFIIINSLKVVKDIPFYTFSNNANSIYIEKDGSTNYTVYIALETKQNQNNIFKFSINNQVFSNPEIVLPKFEVNTFNLQEYQFLDINKDGKLDFSFTSNLNEQKMIFINYDINKQEDKTICIQQSFFPIKFSIADMNGDGQEDLCTGSQNGLVYLEKKTDDIPSQLQNLIGVIRNPEASQFTFNHIIDVNNDGLGDVIDFDPTRDYVKVYKNCGEDKFELIQNYTLPNSMPRYIDFADIDQDGFIDIILRNNNPTDYNTVQFSWMKNNNGINFQNIESLPINYSKPISYNSLAFADFNNDKKTDFLLLGNYFDNGKLNLEVVLLENKNGQLVGKTITSFDDFIGFSHIKAIDFDKDGDVDFVVYSKEYDKPLLFFKNKGQYQFDKIFIENINIEDLEFQDIDNNGIYEIYAWNNDDQRTLNTIFYYTTTDFIKFTKSIIDSYNIYNDNSDKSKRGDLIFFDYNGDNKKDLFLSNYATSYKTISVYRNITQTLDIEEINKNNDLQQLTLYPNPFIETISWNNPENKDYNIKIFTITGKLIQNKNTNNNALNLSNLEKGTYLLNIADQNKNFKRTFKIIKK